MPNLLLPFVPRYLALTVAVVAALVLLAFAVMYPAWNWWIAVPLVLAVWLAGLGLRDLVQTRHAILRNYPIIAHFRFLLENIRPEMRQYFFEGDKDGMPFARDKRAIVCGIL